MTDFKEALDREVGKLISMPRIAEDQFKNADRLKKCYAALDTAIRDNSGLAAELLSPTGREQWGDHVKGETERLAGRQVNVDYAEWLSKQRAITIALTALPLWHNGLGEASNIQGWSAAAKGGDGLEALWHTMQVAGLKASEIPLYAELSHFLTTGKFQLPVNSCSTRFPVSTGQDGKVLKLVLEAVRFPILEKHDLAQRWYPHVDCLLLPVDDDFLNCFHTAAKFWEKQGVVLPRDIVLRWKIQVTNGPYSGYGVKGPSAGLAISLLMGKILAEHRLTQHSY